ncbi:hypothetical protein M992_1279 [Moellerella wisconsensis ATCC 35017]|uniref:Uncharacterized protein n=1 Tax=Moellerella wisconsensis ATCC 35017 TaxID=1354267 RepID=A0A0N1KI07_9GAMM|nr:hypothetical protein M992_1279 [Moellerella wisconsensis ATCC 35017]
MAHILTTQVYSIACIVASIASITSITLMIIGLMNTDMLANKKRILKIGPDSIDWV